MKNSINFHTGDLVTGIAFRGVAEIQGKNNLGQFGCVTESGDSFFVLPENLTLYSDYEPSEFPSDEYFDSHAAPGAFHY